MYGPFREGQRQGTTRRKSARTLRLLLGLLILFGVVRIAVRVGGDAIRLADNFRPLYLCARAWRQGLNPYEIGPLRQAWNEVRTDRDQTTAYLFDRQVNGVPAFWFDTPPLYPPMALVAVWPMTFLSWPIAKIVWLASDISLSILAWMAMVDLAALKWSDWRALAAAAVWTQFGTYATCIRLGNPTAQTVALGILAVWCLVRRRDLAAALLLTAAMALKPQLGGAFFVFAIAARYWRASLFAAILLAIVTGIGVGQLALHHIPWLTSLQADLRAAEAPGRCNDPTAANPDKRWQIVNLQFPLHTMIDNHAVVTAIAWLIPLALGLVFLLLTLRSPPGLPPLLVAGAAGMLCLLPVYHRYYDALIMVIPATWALASLQRGNPATKWAVAVLICTLPFYVSWPYTLNQLAQEGKISAWLLRSHLWNTVLMPVQVWATLLMSVILLIAMREVNRQHTTPTFFPHPL